MNRRGFHNRLSRIEARALEAHSAERHQERREREVEAVVERFLAAVPYSHREAVELALEDYFDRCERLPADEKWDAMPAVVEWIHALVVPGGWFPDPIPVALLDAFLDNPDADAFFFECEDCGVFIPSLPSPRHAPLLDSCPHCGGAVKWAGFLNRHGYHLPMLGRELMEGRDPIADPPHMEGNP